MAVPSGRKTAAQGTSSCRSSYAITSGDLAVPVPVPDPVPVMLPVGSSLPPVQPDSSNDIHNADTHNATVRALGFAAAKARNGVLRCLGAGAPWSPETGGFSMGLRLKPDVRLRLLIVRVTFLVIDHRSGVALDRKVRRSAAIRTG